MCGAFPRIWAIWQCMPSSHYYLLLCSETLVSDRSHISELLVPGFGRPVLCRNGMHRARLMAAYVRDGYGAFCQPKFECGCCEMLYLWCVLLDRTFACSVCIATLFKMIGFMSVYQQQTLPCRQWMCIPSSCLCVTWMAIIGNGWVLLPPAVMVLRPSTLQLYQVVINRWLAQLNAYGGTFNLLMTDVPDLVRVVL